MEPGVELILPIMWFDDEIKMAPDAKLPLMLGSALATPSAMVVANAVLSGVDNHLVEEAFQYGRDVGVAFQLVDALLDFTVSADQLGKPAAADLKLGLATAPVLFAAEKFPELNVMIGRRFSEEGDVEKAFQLVGDSGGLQQTRNLAMRRCEKAVNSLEDFVGSPYKLALIDLCDKIINRIK